MTAHIQSREWIAIREWSAYKFCKRQNFYRYFVLFCISCFRCSLLIVSVDVISYRNFLGNFLKTFFVGGFFYFSNVLWPAHLNLFPILLATMIYCDWVCCFFRLVGIFSLVDAFKSFFFPFYLSHSVIAISFCVLILLGWFDHFDLKFLPANTVFSIRLLRFKVSILNLKSFFTINWLFRN